MHNITAKNFGATEADWTKFDVLMGLTPDMLPVVSNTSATKSPASKINDLGKVPSRYNNAGLVVGFPGWTHHVSTSAEIDAWSKNPDYGIGLQTRRIKAIDVDVTDPDKAQAIFDFIEARVPGLPKRYRENSSKFLVAARVADPDIRKRKFVCEGGAVELLGTGNQFIAAGAHPSGARYEWSEFLDFPVVTPEAFKALWAELVAKFAQGGETRDTGKARHVGGDLDIPDPVADYLRENDLVLGEAEGKLYVACPWSHEHTSGTDGDTSTAWFLAGSNAYPDGNYKCLHLHCVGRHRGDYLAKIGYDFAGDYSVFEEQRRDEQRRQNQEIGEGLIVQPIADSITLKDAIQRFVLLSDGARVVDRKNPHYDLSFNDFVATYAASKETVMVEGRQRDIPVSRLWLSSVERLSVVTRTFKAGAGEFVNDPEGKRAINTWRPPLRGVYEPDHQAAAMFFNHVRWLWGDDAERFLDWLAHIEQNPGVLPHTAWLHIGDKMGLGRNWIAGVLARVWAGSVASNFDLMAMLKSGFNGRLSRKVLVTVDELREGGSGNPWEHTQKLKSMFNEETRTINPKYGRVSVEYNAARWLMFSNYTTAIPLEDDDRRIEVVRYDGMPKEPGYYATLYDAIDEPGFIAGVADLLANRDISQFNPGAHAVKTVAKLQVIDSNKSAVQEICELVRDLWPSDVIRSDCLIEIIGDHCGKASQAGRRHVYDSLRFVAVKKTVRVDGIPKRLTIIRNAGKWQGATGSELADEVIRGDSIVGDKLQTYEAPLNYLMAAMAA